MSTPGSGQLPSSSDRSGEAIGTAGVLERESFLEQLDALLGEASWRGGRLVLIHGDAGIGKSTLVEAFAAGRRDRVVWGTCDPVTPPRPLAPIVDIALQVGGELRTALADESRLGVHSAFLDLLRRDGGPWVCVLEDLQWADEATLELLKVVGRRVAQLPTVVVGTFRDEEVGPDHPLSVTLGDIPAKSRVSVALPPLSAAAVGKLVAGTGIDPTTLHAASGGNPFFVTEVLEAGGEELPATVRDAVWARAKRLTPPAVAVLRAAAVLGCRSDADALGLVSGAQPADIDECVAQGMLRSVGRYIEFRHELSQRAVLDSLPAADRAALHGKALGILRQRTSVMEPAELAHHAVEAGDADAVLELAPQAAARAAALGAHRAALGHYDNAIRYLSRLSSVDQASLLVAHAYECYLADDLERAIASQERAVASSTDADDAGAEGRALSQLALYLFWHGAVGQAMATADRAVEILESMPRSEGLAVAYARLAQLWMVTRHNELAMEWGRQAVDLAEQLGEEQVLVHALNTIGSAETQMGLEEGISKIEDSLQRARDANLEEDVARALNNLVASTAEHRRYEIFDRYAADALNYATERDLDVTSRCMVGDLAEVALERGRWDEAESFARANVEGGWRNGRLQCLWVLGRLAARRGDRHAQRYIDDAFALAQEPAPGMELCKMSAARAEAAWLARDYRRVASEVHEGLAVCGEYTDGWSLGDLVYWAWKIDPSVEIPDGVAEPYALLFAGHPDKAAAAWATVGCPYAEAMALADSDDGADVRRSLEILLTLGAVPAAGIVTERLRAMGVRRISRGPRPTTRANPAGLSNREMEVLGLLGEGLRNAEIAERLVLSTKTVDHHVSAVLAKLGAKSRYEAGRQAVDMGLAK